MPHYTRVAASGGMELRKMRALLFRQLAISPHTPQDYNLLPSASTGAGKPRRIAGRHQRPAGLSGARRPSWDGCEIGRRRVCYAMFMAINSPVQRLHQRQPCELRRGSRKFALRPLRLPDARARCQPVTLSSRQRHRRQRDVSHRRCFCRDNADVSICICHDRIRALRSRHVSHRHALIIRRRQVSNASAMPHRNVCLWVIRRDVSAACNPPAAPRYPSVSPIEIPTHWLRIYII